jgi:AraC-like DNA-binding protein
LSEFYAYKPHGYEPSKLIHHNHDCHELVLVESGQVSFSIENTIHEVGPHALVIIGNLERHHIFVDSIPYQRRVMLIPNAFLTEKIRIPQLVSFFLYRPKGFEHVIYLDDTLYQKIEVHFDNIIEEFKGNLQLKEQRLEVLFELLLIDLFRSKYECFSWENREDMNIVYQVQRYVSQNFTQNITLSATAERFHVSQYYLSHRFQNIAGYGFQQYLIFCRLNEAKRLLMTTDLPVSILCEQCGYEDTNNFIRAFRRREGITPLQFRKTMKDHQIGGSCQSKSV